MDRIGASLNVLGAILDVATGLAVVAGIVAAGSRAFLFLRFEDAVLRAKRALARWLMLALELALAADVVRSAYAPTWDDIGKLAAIAALRTALNLTLEREIERGATSVSVPRTP